MTNPRIIRVELDGQVDNAGRVIQAAILQQLIFVTPVDTGFVRSRWTPTLGGADTSVVDRPMDRDEAKRIAAANLRAINAASRRIGSTWTADQGTILITNTTRYLAILNGEGTSSQAPARFVDRAVAAGFMEAERRLAS
jgi:hypothetical protein